MSGPDRCPAAVHGQDADKPAGCELENRDEKERRAANAQEDRVPPVQNGLDYLKSAVEHLRGDPGPRELKYAVLHLQAAAEVLLKVQLIRVQLRLLVVFRREQVGHTQASIRSPALRQLVHLEFGWCVVEAVRPLDRAPER